MIYSSGGVPLAASLPAATLLLATRCDLPASPQQLPGQGVKPKIKHFIGRALRLSRSSLGRTSARHSCTSIPSPRWESWTAPKYQQGGRTPPLALRGSLPTQTRN